MKTKWVAVVLLGLLLAACKDIDTGSCSTDEECGPLAVCQHAVCVHSELPAVVIAVDRDEVHIGETLQVDARASWSRTGGMLSWGFSVSPEDAATIVASVDVPGVAWFTVVRPHVDIEVVVEATDTWGNRSVARRTVPSKDSPPTITWSFSPDPFQPGDVVTLVADASDPDGDELTFRWSLEGSLGALVDEGPTARLHTVLHRDDIVYRVTAEVVAHGEEATHTADLSGRNRAPILVPEDEPSAHHHCRGDEGCESRIPLIASIDEVGEVEVHARILSGPPDATVDLEPNESGGFDGVVRCKPICRIAGDYRIEVRASDEEGLESRLEIAARVLNRPPVLTAHDGTTLDHRFHGGGLFRVDRPSGTVLVWSDPDGDPLDLSKIRWTASSPIVSFSPETAIDPAVVAIGTKDQLSNLSITIHATDINGAEASDTRPLPVGNRPPRVFFEGDDSEGHEFAGTDFRVPILRKRFLVPVDDPDGDPLEVRVRLPIPTPDGLTVHHEGDERWYLEMLGSDLLGQSIPVTVEVGDAWGEWTSARGAIRISNRPPEVTRPPGMLKTGRGCSRESCCAAWSGSTCTQHGTGSVLTAFDVPGPAVFSAELHVVDPDGDPVVVTLHPGSLSRGYAWFRDMRTFWGDFTQPQTLVCTGASATGLVCSYQVRFFGKSDTGGTCRIDTGSPQAVLPLEAVLDDGMGAAPSTSFTLSTVSVEGPCP